MRSGMLMHHQEPWTAPVVWQYQRWVCPCTSQKTGAHYQWRGCLWYPSRICLPSYQCLTDKLAVMDDVTGSHHSLWGRPSQAQWEPGSLCEETGRLSQKCYWAVSDAKLSKRSRFQSCCWGWWRSLSSCLWLCRYGGSGLFVPPDWAAGTTSSHQWRAKECTVFHWSSL